MLSLVISIATGSGTHEVKLGEKARLKAEIDSDTQMLCGALAMSSRMYSASDAVESLTSGRLPPSRKDLRHRHYLPLEPSHRVANLEYMRTGILLPFGAHNVYFNEPNRSLFSPKGEWLQRDFDDPIKCWDIDEVIKSGNAHGASREDLYGCLYFHVSDQLYEFADRLSRFDISLNILGRDAVELSSSIKKGDLTSQFGIPSSIRFDRIDVSNIVDEHYKIGIAGVIDAWGDFLKPDKEATIIGHFTNWSGKDVDAEPNGHNCDAEALFTIAQNKGRLPDLIPPELKTAKSLAPKNRDRLRALMSMVTAMTHTMITSVYDNSRAFDRYLLNYGLDDALKRNKLKRKTKHTIVPHRLCASVHDPPSALPEFKDKDSWYLHSRIHSMTWTERYIEICRS
ncbi:hypothetical protein PHLGIDRAFT_93808 [Phlebiopsis gigantea 11061_1 CR5-6]|uniref:Uncharacterized protein n=1 Tax=Phlebiopsis gigantea (strain 11061_1 CR5-6) TaxID=745531 RepID=A0A0C3S330_PHLG1|nr:hypothetical protein PHLGIDRAFT_93808 [Phlebiopsis gigantea 11061_1 CR5-6]